MSGDVKPIRTNADYEAALLELKKLWGAKSGTIQGDRLDVLATLIDAYESQHFPMDPPDPVEAIRYCVEQQGRSQSDLAVLLGSRSRASEILSRRRPLTLEMVRKLHLEWRIPAESLLRAYDLAISG